MMYARGVIISTIAVIGIGLSAPEKADAAGVQLCLQGAEYAAPTADPLDCDSSTNTVIANVNGLGQLTVPELIQTVVDQCDLPNGPYRRLNAAGAGGDARLDYVTVSASTPSSGASTASGNGSAGGTVQQQLGINPGFELSVSISGSSSSNSGTFTISDTSSPPGGSSQILDAQGFEFIVFLKSSGNQAGTIVCDENMWYDLDGLLPHTDFVYGLKNFTTSHGVNSIVVGWAGGPSPFGSQVAVNSACAAINDGLTVADQTSTSNAVKFREKYTGFIGGFYKTLAGDPPPAANGTSCSNLSEDYARYCDDSEPPGSVNSCNAESELGGTIGAASFGQLGTGSTFVFTATGTPTKSGN